MITIGIITLLQEKINKRIFKIEYEYKIKEKNKKILLTIGIIYLILGTIGYIQYI